jgi:hypothetical protein
MSMHKLRTVTTALLFMAAGSAAAADKDKISFDMVVSKAASNCLPDAQARVTIDSKGRSRRHVDFREWLAAKDRV